MMPQGEYIDLGAQLGKVLSAHRAVKEGIATHAQKERDKQQSAYQKMEAENKLKQAVANNEHPV